MTLSHTIKLILVGPDPEQDQSDRLSSTEVVLKKEEISTTELHKAEVPDVKTNKTKITVSSAYTDDSKNTKSKLKVDPMAKVISPTASNGIESKFRKPSALSTKDDYLLNSTNDPKVFFEKYEKITKNLLNNNKRAALETMNAQRDVRTKDFIDRSVGFAAKQTHNLKSKKDKIEYIENWVEDIRNSDPDLSIDVRAHLAVAKKEAINRIKDK